jgi:competence protein ComEA
VARHTDGPEPETHIDRGASSFASPFAPRFDTIGRAIEAARRHPALVAAIAAIAIVGAIATWRVVAAPPAQPPEAHLPMATRGPTSDASGAPATTHASDVVVHVAGAVARSGVYRLSDGARVVDALSAAGGARTDADLARVNLAARLSDGLRVYVPAVGEAVVPPVEGQDSETGNGPINLNSATAEQLDDLPGIGPATAAAIVAYRRDHGPFQSVDQLLDVRGIGAAKLEQIRSLLVV